MSEQITTTREGHVFKTIDKQLHSTDDEPAVTYADGTRWWYAKGQIHRSQGKPAVVWHNGVEEFWEQGQRLRVVFPNAPGVAMELRGVTQYWSNGKMLSEAVPPLIARYRQMVLEAQIACGLRERPRGTIQ